MNLQVAFIYGSVAEGSERQASDLDLFVLGRVSGPALHKALARAKAAIHREVNTTRFELEEVKKRLKHGDSFLKDVVRGKKVFVIGTEDEFKRAIGSRPS